MRTIEKTPTRTNHRKINPKQNQLRSKPQHMLKRFNLFRKNGRDRHETPSSSRNVSTKRTKNLAKAGCLIFTLVFCLLATLQVFPETNSPPVAASDSYTGVAARSQSAPGVLANDSDPDGDPISVGNPGLGVGTVAVGPQHGSLNLYSNGEFSYGANPGYTGNDSFTYNVCDSYNCTQGTVTLTTPNSAPSASGESYTGVNARHQNAPGVLANDTDPDGLIIRRVCGLWGQHDSYTAAAWKFNALRKRRILLHAPLRIHGR